MEPDGGVALPQSERPAACARAGAGTCGLRCPTAFERSPALPLTSNQASNCEENELHIAVSAGPSTGLRRQCTGTLGKHSQAAGGRPSERLWAAGTGQEFAAAKRSGAFSWRKFPPVGTGSLRVDSPAHCGL